MDNESYYLVRHLNNINTLVKYSKLNEHSTACKNKLCKLDASIIITKAIFWLLYISQLVQSEFQTFRKNNGNFFDSLWCYKFLSSKIWLWSPFLKDLSLQCAKHIFSIETKLCITIKQLAYPN